MRAAIPAYLGSQFADASPGHRFGLYYAGWNADFSQPKSGKTDALKAVCAFPAHSQKLLAALLGRQKTHAAAAPDTVLTLPHVASSPFASGLGNEHPLENGFSFLTPYGLPYLPGSGVKGVIRRAAEELAGGEWGDAQGWDAAAILALFGPGEKDFARDRDTDPQQGALRFWDVLPQTPKHSLSVEIMTPHLGAYYQGDSTPNTSLSPVPIPFLAIPPETTFLFHVEVNPSRIVNGKLPKNWMPLIEAAFAHAGKWLGFGAKTAVGYGRMALDPAIANAREAERERQQTLRLAQAEAARRDALPADERLLAELENQLGKLPLDPRSRQPIKQATSIEAWKTALDLLAAAAASLAGLPAPRREALAGAAKAALVTRFKVEGKAEKALKEQLAALRAPGA